MREQAAEWRNNWREANFEWRCIVVFLWVVVLACVWLLGVLIASAFAKYETVLGEVQDKYRRSPYYTWSGRSMIYHPASCYAVVKHGARVADVSVPCGAGWQSLKAGDKILAPFPK